MRIAINLLYLIPGVVGGTETYAAGLLAGLSEVGGDHEFLVYVNRESASWPLPPAAKIRRVVCPVAASNQVRRYAFEQAVLPRLLRKHRVDLVHSLGYVSPLATPCPRVVTIPDLNYLAWGRQMPRVRSLALRFFVRRSALRARCVITISEFSRQQIVNAFGLAASRVVVTPLAVKRGPGPDTTAPGSQAGTGDAGGRPYIVAFSSTTPNKNIPNLLRAFALARERHRIPHRLVLVGHSPADSQAAAEAVAKLDGDVHFTGYLDDDELWKVLTGADLLAFPSLYEGFGLPLLEAMSRGVPVVCSNRASLPEVAGDAAVFFDPHSVPDMAEKLGRVALDAELRAELVRRGYTNAARFSWEATARKTLEVYREAVQPRGAAALATGRQPMETSNTKGSLS